MLRILAGKPVAESLSITQRKQLNDCDILLHLGRYLWQMEFDYVSRQIVKHVQDSDDPRDKDFAKQLAQSLKEVQHAQIGFRLDEGIDFHFLATAPKDGEAAKLLATLRARRKPSTLQGLPDGNVLFAQASSGDAEQQALLARSLFNYFLAELLVEQKIVNQVDRLHLLGIFHEVWRQLQGNRFAVYQNADESKLGLFSAVAILDTADAGQFLRDMRTLTKMAVGESLDWSKKEVKDEIDLARLVKDLGSSVYVVRQSATTRLALIGEPALPYLQKAIDSKQLDLEALRRSRDLRERISTVAAQRRKELLSEKNLPLFFRPRLTYVANAEKRQGHSIDIIDVKIAGLEKVANHQYRQLLGPDWDKLRLAVIGNQVVVLLGSDVTLFDAALRHLKDGGAGLAGSKRLATFHQRCAPERLFEFHVSIEGILRLITPKAQRDTPLALTSAALTLGQHSLQFDARMPLPEVRLLAKKAREAAP